MTIARRNFEVFRKRRYLITMDDIDDWDLAYLLMTDHARLVAENFAKKVISSPYYKNDVKKAIKKLYNPQGNSYSENASLMGGVYKGLVIRVQKEITSCMTEEQQLNFSLMAAYIDDSVKEELDTMRNECDKMVEDSPFSHKEYLKPMIFYMHVMQVLNIASANMSANNQGSKFLLCKDVNQPTPHYVIEDKHIEQMQVLVESICKLALRTERGLIKLSEELTNAAAMFAGKLTSGVVIYGAALEGGLDLTKTSESSPYQEKALKDLHEIQNRRTDVS